MSDEKRWQDRPINNQDKSKKVTVEILYKYDYCQLKKLKLGDSLNGGVITAIS